MCVYTQKAKKMHKIILTNLDLVDGCREKRDDSVGKRIHLGVDSEPYSIAHWVLIIGKIFNFSGPRNPSQ